MIKRIMKGLLAVCCALTMVSIQGVYAAEGEPVIIDDTDERFVYSEGDANHGGWGSADGSDPAASEHWSNTPGATLEISFEGNVLEKILWHKSTKPSDVYCFHRWRRSCGM